MTAKNEPFMAATSNRGILRLLHISSNLATLGLLFPFVTLALVLANVLGHVHGTLRVFCGFATLVMFGGALSRAIMLSLTLRIGKLKVSGKLVHRQEEPRRFWTWIAVTTLPLIFDLAGLAVLGWATVYVSA